MDTYEKRFKEAFSRAKKLHETCDSQAVVGWCEYIFPELCESEDKRIRKGIKSILEHYKESGEVVCPYPFVSIDEALAWLEKQGTSYTKKDVDDAFVEGIAFAKNELEKQGEQKPIDKIQLGKKYKCIASPRYSTFRRGNIYKPVDNFLCNLMNLCYECFEPIEDSEQKPADKVEPKFKVEDWVVHDMSDGRKVIRQIVNITNKSYVLDGEDFNTFYFNDLENNYHLWTIQDAKNGDVLAEDPIEGYPSSFVTIYKKQNGEDFDSYCFVGFDGKFYKGENGHSTEEIHPATKEQRDTLIAKIKEAGYEWDDKKKELKEIDQLKLTKFEEAVKDMMDDYRDAIDENAATTEEVKEHAAYLLSLIPHLKKLKE